MVTLKLVLVVRANPPSLPGLTLMVYPSDAITASAFFQGLMRLATSSGYCAREFDTSKHNAFVDCKKRHIDRSLNFAVSF